MKRPRILLADDHWIVAEGLKSIEAELQRAIANDTVATYQNALRRRYPVEIDRNALQTLF